MPTVETRSTIGLSPRLEEALASPLAGQRTDPVATPAPVRALPMAGPRTGLLLPRFLGLPPSLLGVIIPTMRRR